MAIFRQIHTSIWKDTWFLDLAPDEKLLFIYLFSNESSSLAGIYEISPKVVAFETGLNLDFISKSLSKFKKAGKVDFEDGIIWVKKMRAYHETSSSTVQTRIKIDIEKIPDCSLLTRYLDGRDTLSIPYISGENKQKVPDIPYAQPSDTLAIPPLNKAKQSKAKQNKEKKRKPEPEQSGGVLFFEKPEDLKLYLYHLWDQDPDDYNIKFHQMILKQITPHGSDKVTSMALELCDQGLDFDGAIKKMADTKKGLTMWRGSGEPGYY